jgi:tetratricopeptide (TPR) repeat protein
MQRVLQDPDPLLRQTAAAYFPASDSAVLLQSLAPLLGDHVKSVRMEAANRLSSVPKTRFDETRLTLFTGALNEYRLSQEYVADFPTGRFSLGNFYNNTGEKQKAIENYRQALIIDNLFYPAKINLALLYYGQGKQEPAETLFLDLVKNHPDVPEGSYYLALLYGEQKRYAEAIVVLEKAVDKPGVNPRIYYNLGLLYQSTGRNDQAEATLMKGLAMDPCNFDLLYALFTFHLKQDGRRNAASILERLRTCFPGEPAVQELAREFNRRGA